MVPSVVLRVRFSSLSHEHAMPMSILGTINRNRTKNQSNQQTGGWRRSTIKIVIYSPMAWHDLQQQSLATRTHIEFESLFGLIPAQENLLLVVLVCL